MRVIVPFTRQYHPLARAAHDEIVGLERIDVSARGDSYQELIASLWEQGEDFLIIEQDIVPTSKALQEAEECDCFWGVSPYVGPGNRDDMIYKSLGFVRFRKELLQEFPNFPSVVQDLCKQHSGTTVGHWRNLDSRVADALTLNKYEHCEHSPVLHHHVYEGRCVCLTTHASYPVDTEGRYDPK